MKKSFKKLTVIVMALIMLSALFTGCADGNNSDDSQSSTSSVQGNSSSHKESSSSGSENESQSATLYIGSYDQFKTFPLEYTGDLTPEKLISGIAEKTGWNLDLADKVTMGKGGVTVSFAKASSLFKGAPENQKEDFFVHDLDGLAASILDSVKETLQNNFVDVEAGGNPDSLSVYFCTEDNKPIVIDEINLNIPVDSPYTSYDDFHK